MNQVYTDMGIYQEKKNKRRMAKAKITKSQRYVCGRFVAEMKKAFGLRAEGLGSNNGDQ
jgi:hypothetical protein